LGSFGLMKGKGGNPVEKLTPRLSKELFLRRLTK
jgi:hypothetical protein